jgi:hypothetical protein
MKPATKAKKPFDQRAFTVLGAALTGLGLPITGIANHLYQHDPTSVSLHAWMPAHWILGFLFIFFVVWHLVLNRRTLWKHIQNSVKSRVFISREAFYAFTIVAFLLALSIGLAMHEQHENASHPLSSALAPAYSQH